MPFHVKTFRRDVLVGAMMLADDSNDIRTMYGRELVHNSALVKHIVDADH